MDSIDIWSHFFFFSFECFTVLMFMCRLFSLQYHHFINDPFVGECIVLFYVLAPSVLFVDLQWGQIFMNNIIIYHTIVCILCLMLEIFNFLFD